VTTKTPATLDEAIEILRSLDTAGGYTMVKPAGRRAINCYAIRAEVWQRAADFLARVDGEDNE
jgi:hypothetical protein